MVLPVTSVWLGVPYNSRVSMSRRKSTVQLARAVAAYVSEGRTQTWIAEKLNMSQPRVSQLLSYLSDAERPTYRRGRPRSR